MIHIFIIYIYIFLDIHPLSKEKKTCVQPNECDCRPVRIPYTNIRPEFLSYAIHIYICM